MSNISEFFNKENSHKVFKCVINGEEVFLQCYYDRDYDIVEAYSWENHIDDDVNYLDDIQEVVEEIVFEEDVCDFNDHDVDYETLSKFSIGDNIYAYNTNEELHKIIEASVSDIVNGDIDSQFGIVHLYSEYDDFSCSGYGFTNYAKIIDGAKIVK